MSVAESTEILRPIAQRRPPAPRLVQTTRAGKAGRLLVGEQTALAGTHRLQYRQQPGGTDNRRHDDIAAGITRHRLQRFCSSQHLDAQPGTPDHVFKASRGGRIAQHGDLGMKTLALFEQSLCLGIGSERHDAVTLRVTGQNIQRANADRTGSTEYGDALQPGLGKNTGAIQSHGRGHHSPPDGVRHNNHASANMGAAAVKASIRSSTPPCPGKMVPLSLTAAARLARLSNKSPNTDTKAVATDSAIHVASSVPAKRQPNPPTVHARPTP